MELDAGLNLGLLHLVGVGEREGAEQVDTLAANVDFTFGNGAVALQGKDGVTDMQQLVFRLIDFGMHLAHRQFSTHLPTHDGCSGLRYVELEVGLESHLLDVGHVHRLTEMERVGAHGA